MFLSVDLLWLPLNRNEDYGDVSSSHFPLHHFGNKKVTLTSSSKLIICQNLAISCASSNLDGVSVQEWNWL